MGKSEQFQWRRRGFLGATSAVLAGYLVRQSAAAEPRVTAGDLAEVRLENQVDRTGDVLHVTVWTPEVFAIDLQLSFDHGVSGEFVDGQVEARA